MSSYPQWPCVGVLQPIQHVFLIVATYTMFDIVRANQSSYSTLLVNRYSFFNPLYMEMDVMFASSDFGIARSVCVGLHHPTSFGRVGWQSCNVPMGRRALNL
jgi:hypothetical protein